MLRANILALAIGIPVAALQLSLFILLRGALQVSLTVQNILLFIAILLISVVAHELIHGLTWKALKKSSAAIAYGVQWKTLTPYAHLNEPIDVNTYRIGGLMPGLLLGIIPYILSLGLGNRPLLWFGVFHTFAAGGDWLILWTLRRIKRGTLVEDHPSRAGCYVFEA